MGFIAAVAEKSSQAKDIATALGWTKTNRGFEGSLNGQQYVLQWARGHLISHEEPDEIQPGLGWDNPFALHPIPRAVRYRASKDDKGATGETVLQRLAAIGRVLKDADSAIICTDADREGEQIGWTVLDHFKFNKPVTRAWFSGGYDKVSVSKAVGNPLDGSIKRSMARAAEARALCDRAYMYLVRALSFYGRKGMLGEFLGQGKGRESVVSVGRVQTSALYMIYRRELAIEAFSPQDYFNIIGNFSISGVSLESEYEPKVTAEIIDSGLPGIVWLPQGKDDEEKLDKPLFVDRDAVKSFKARLMAEAANAKVVEYVEGTRSVHPRPPHDMVSLSSDIARQFKTSSHAADAVIEDLYEQKLITYPRTANKELPMSMYEPGERDTRLQSIESLVGISDAVKVALDIHNNRNSSYKAFKPKCYVSKKLEHYGLIPSYEKVTESVLARISPRKQVKGKVMHTAEMMQYAYRAIAKAYVCALLPPARYATQSIRVAVPTHDLMGAKQSIFSAKSSRLIDPGYKAFLPEKDSVEINLPKLTQGSPATLKDVAIKSSKTQSPARYGESNFSKALQRAAREINDPALKKYMNDGASKPEGIGTPSTRKEIVPTLTARNYIKTVKGQYYLEPKGRELIEFLINNNIHFMYRIETTAEWEGRLSELAMIEDEAAAEDFKVRFVEHTLRSLDKFIQWLNKKNASGMTSTVTALAEKQGVSASELLADPEKMTEFMRVHGSSAAGEPSPAQLSFAEKIEVALNISAGAEAKKSRELLSAFIEKHKKAFEKDLGAKPPTPGMIKFAKSLIEKLPVDKRPGPDVLERMDACRKFLDKAKNGGGQSGSSSKSKASGNRGSARRSGTKR